MTIINVTKSMSIRCYPTIPPRSASRRIGANQVGTRPGRTATYGSRQSGGEPREGEGDPAPRQRNASISLDDLLARRNGSIMRVHRYTASLGVLSCASFWLDRRHAGTGKRHVERLRAGRPRTRRDNNGSEKLASGGQSGPAGRAGTAGHKRLARVVGHLKRQVRCRYL